MLAISLVAAALVASSLPKDGSAVSLQGQRGELDVSGKVAVLRFSALAKNVLPVAVEGVRVGVLFAEDGAILRKLDPAAAYKKGPGVHGDFGVLDQYVAVPVRPGAEAELHVEAPAHPDGPAPRAFVTHVLGYSLTQVDGPLLLELLETAAAADELAAVLALGLSGDAATRQTVRHRYGADTDLVATLGREVTKPIPERPDESATMRRVYASRALGVLGGDAAAAALRALRDDPALHRFDEPLQVLRIARLVGSRLETPLAFAVPPEANTMREVVVASLEDVEGLSRASADGDGASAPGGGAAASLDNAGVDAVGGDATRGDVRSGHGATEPTGGTSSVAVAVLTALITFAVVAVALAAWQRRARRHDGAAS